MFSEAKHPLLSKGVIGGLVAAGMGGVQLFGYATTPADAAELSTAITGLITSGAGVLAVIGRIMASKRISLRG